MNVTELDSMRPHITITGLDNNIHDIPQSLFNEIIKGKVDVTVIEDYQNIIPAILKEWQSMILRGCND